MVHEMREEFFDFPLEDYILTFDDGLYSQYYFFKDIKKINTDKIFFISTEIVADEDVQQSMDFPTCSEAHDEFFNTGEADHYMKWSQIEIIHNTSNCIIGGHSHSHQRISSEPKLLISDTKRMKQSFKDNLKCEPDMFCFPYNADTGIYRSILSTYGFSKFYGDERLDIYDL